MRRALLVPLMMTVAAGAVAADGHYFRYKGTGAPAAQPPGTTPDQETPRPFSLACTLPQGPAVSEPASGGCATVPAVLGAAFTVVSAPEGVAIADTGAFQGTFTRAGIFDLVVEATADGRTERFTGGLMVLPRPPELALTAATPAQALVSGGGYAATFSETTGTHVASLALSSGPAWLSVSPGGQPWTVSGVLPADGGSFSYEVRGTDAFGRTVRLATGPVAYSAGTGSVASLSRTILEGSDISGQFATNLPGAAWTLLDGPPWMQVDPSGRIQGTAWDVAGGGTGQLDIPFTARASNGTGQVDVSDVVHVVAGTASATGVPATLASGGAYAGQVSSNLGAGTTFSIVDGPGWIAVDPTSGAVSGTAPVLADAARFGPFKFRARRNQAYADAGDSWVDVRGRLSAAYPAGKAAFVATTSSSVTSSLRGGCGGGTYSLKSGILYPGIALAQDGRVSYDAAQAAGYDGSPGGSPTSFGATILVRDDCGEEADVPLQVEVATEAPTLGAPGGLTLVRNQAGSTSAPAITLGRKPYGSVTLASGSLTGSGLSVAADGRIAGTPTGAAGTAYGPLTLKVSDAQGRQAVSPSFSVTIDQSAIRIVSGTYGANCPANYNVQTNNVGAQLSAACNGRMSCNYVVDHTVIGDKCPGTAKRYDAVWTCQAAGVTSAEKSVTATAEASGKTIVLSCP